MAWRRPIIWTNAQSNKLLWKFNWNSNIFIEENSFESVVCECEIAAFLPRPLRWRHNGRDSVSITSLTSVFSTVYSDADQRKYQSSASLAFVRGIHRGPVNSPHKWPVTRKLFPFDDVIMASMWQGQFVILVTLHVFVLMNCSAINEDQVVIITILGTGPTPSYYDLSMIKMKLYLYVLLRDLNINV